jgi:succinate dehydrogenase/fumarate reductase flavoprotein subunit
MSLETTADKVIETDVMIIGGGMAGCTAAAKAAEHGLDVTIVEKAHTSRSGSAAAGLDHNNVAHLDNLKGVSVTDIVTSFENRQMVIQGYGRWGDPNILATALEKGKWVSEELENMGVPLKWDDGDYYFIPGVWFDGVRMVMRVHWQSGADNDYRSADRQRTYHRRDCG